VPEPVKIAFRSFSDIKDPRTYAAPDESLLLQAGCSSSLDPNFNLTEWWRIAEGEKLSGPFNVGDELVAGVLQVLERVSPFLINCICPIVNQGYRGCPAQGFVPGQ
jgi:hypothetical protein